ncbi:MAG TPA: alkaline phosphatase [Chloroflexi bacterium]|nr:alkaline phosphatase [Chloroflexota bacterium]
MLGRRGTGRFPSLAGPLLVGLMVAVLVQSAACSRAVGSSERAYVTAFPIAMRRPPIKYIIVFICDGCGYNHFEAANLFQHGARDARVDGEFPLCLAMSTYSTGSYDPQAAWSDPAYVTAGATDSAAAATAMSTGVKTTNGTIGLDADGERVTHLLEHAERRGMATGLVTSVQLCHGTPSGFVAHQADRHDYPRIAQEMLITSTVDVIMGSGHPWFDDDGQPLDADHNYQYVGGEDTWHALMAGTLPVADADRDGTPDRWSLVEARAEFQKLQQGATPSRVLGVAQVGATLQQRRSGDALADPYVVPRNETVPTLAEMALGAINVLDDDPDGFFLMVEGGATDWAAQNNQSGRMVEELLEFAAAVRAVREWVDAHARWEETLLVVTSDHETGYLTGPSSDGDWAPLLANGAGALPSMQWNSKDHTNSLVPLCAKGAGSDLLALYADEVDPVRGPYLDNTELAQAIQRLLR